MKVTTPSTIAVSFSLSARASAIVISVGNVYVATATALLSKPSFTAIALMVVVVDTDIGLL